MIRSRRSRVAVAALVTVGGVLAGCAAGQEAQTATQQPTIDGANAEVGPIALRNVGIEYPDNGLYRRGGVARLRLLIANTGNQPEELVEVRTEVASEVAIVAGQTEEASPRPSLGPEGTVSPSGTAGPSETGTATPTGTPTEGPPEEADQSVSATPPNGASQSPAASPSETGTIPGTTVTIAPNNSVSIGEGSSQSALLLRGLTEELRSTQIISITFVFRTAGSVTVPVPVAIPGEREPAPTIPAESEEEAGESGSK